MKKYRYIFILSMLIFCFCQSAKAEWDWKNDNDLMIWSYADTGIENINGGRKWRDNSKNSNHFTIEGTPEIKENALGGHRAMKLSSSENEYFYVDFDEPYIGSSTIFIVGSMNEFKEYKGMFSTSTPNSKKTHNTFETYLLNRNIESASMTSSGSDINKDRQFNKEGFLFNKYQNFISRYENIEENGVWKATNLRTYYGVYDEASGSTDLSCVGNFGNRAYNSGARFNTYAGFSLGSRWNFTGETPDAEFAEVIIFKRALSEAEILKVSEYISDKYFKAPSENEEDLNLGEGIDLWIKAQNYPEDTNFNGSLNLEDFSADKKYIEAENGKKIPGFIERYINGYGAYDFKGDDIMSAEYAAYSGEGTVFIAADIGGGNIFSTGQNGVNLAVENNILNIISKNDYETVSSEDLSGLRIYAVRIKNSGERRCIQAYIDGARVLNCEKTAGWNVHNKYVFGGGDFMLCEAIFYKRALNDREVSKICEYLSDKYCEKLKISEIKNNYLNEAGEPCEVVCESGAFKTIITLENNSEKNIENMHFVCALYDKGRLVSISVSPDYLIEKGKSVGLSGNDFIKLPDDLSETEIKYMFWSGEYGLTPVRGIYNRVFTFYD